MPQGSFITLQTVTGKLAEIGGFFSREASESEKADEKYTEHTAALHEWNSFSIQIQQ